MIKKVTLQRFIIIGSIVFAVSLKGIENPVDDQQKTTEQQIAEVASIYKGVVELHVKLGQYVKKDQLLFSLNADILNTQKKYAEENLDFMKVCLSRANRLIAKHSISQDDFQQCERDLKVAENYLNSINAQIKYSKYSAPFNGTVTNVVRYTGSGIGDNDNEVQVTEGKIAVNTKKYTGIICNRWPGILELKVKLGDKVEKEQLLLNIKTDVLIAEIKQKKANAEYAEKLYERRKKLYETVTVSLYEYYKSKIDYQFAVMNLEIAEIVLKQSSAYAPFNGTITKIYRYSGSGNGECKPVLEITVDE